MRGKEMAMRPWQTALGGTDDSSEEREDDVEGERGIKEGFIVN